MTQAKVDQDTNEPIITANKYVKSHLRNVIISLLLLFFFAKFDYNLLHKLAKPIFLVAILFLILVKLVGDMRTIPLYFIGFHPTELAKFAIVIFFSAMIVKHQNNTKSFNDFYLPAIF
jgi:cell division protein FtsW